MILRFGACSLLLTATVVACFPDPHGDYNDFVEKTAEQRQQAGEPPDGGGIVVEAGPPPAEATTGTYFVACLPNLGFGDVSKSLRFVGRTEYTPAEEGVGGKLSLKLAPIPLAQADAGVTTATYDVNDTVGEPLNVGDAIAVGADGKFNGAVAVATIDGSANPISGGNITVENIKLGGTFTASGPFCSGFEGKVTAPIKNDFIAKCIYLPVEDGTAYTITATSLTIDGQTFGASDFGCK